MDLKVARRHPQRRLRLIHRRVEMAARRQRLGHAVMAARELGRHRQCVLVPAFRFLKQPHRPERVTVQRHRLRARRVRREQLLGLGARQIELGDPQRRRDHTHPRTADAVARRDLQGVAIGVERVEEFAFGEQDVSELHLDFDRLGRRGHVRTNNQRSSRDDGRHRDCTAGVTHDPSRKTRWFRNLARSYKNRTGCALRRGWMMHPAGPFGKRKMFQRV